MHEYMNLVDFCKNHEFVILNGRAFKDKTIGEFTCKGVSVVDYVLTSCKAIELLCDFEVLDCYLMYIVLLRLTYNAMPLSQKRSQAFL